MEALLLRLSLMSSAAVCFLLSVVVYARLSGYDLGVSSLATTRAGQTALVFAFIGITLGLAVSAFTRTAGAGGFPLGVIALHGLAAGALVTGLVLAGCYLADGNLGDLDHFLRFEAARASAGAAFLLASISYALASRWKVGDAFASQSQQWLKAGAASVLGLVAVAVAVYVWDHLRPWPVVAVEQILIVVAGVIGPAFVLGVLAASQRGLPRMCALCGAVVFVFIASLL
jgi:hypothetical protein